MSYVISPRVPTRGHPMLRRRVIDKEAAEEIRNCYCEMPGLALTVPQAARLFDLDTQQVEVTFDSLVGQGFLRRARDRFVRNE